MPFDSDMIGPFGYCADISRTFLCGDQAPTGEQLDLYKRSLDEIWHNTELLRVGASFEELSHSVMRQPEHYRPTAMGCRGAHREFTTKSETAAKSDTLDFPFE